MRIKDKKVEALEESLIPSLRFDILLEFQKLIEAPLSAEGFLLSEDNKILASIHTDLFSIGQGTSIDLGVSEKQEPTTTNISFIIPLSGKALDYIDSVRDKNSKKKVVLTCKLKIRSLVSKAVLSSVREIGIKMSDSVSPEVKPDIKQSYPWAETICSMYATDYTPSRGTMWIISGNSGPAFLTLNEQEVSILFEIPSSTWTDDFAPHLGLGRFFLVEIPMLELVEVTEEEFEIRVNSAITSLKKIEKSIVNGEWNEVMEDIRPVHELLRDEVLIKDILKKDGYTDEAADDLLNSIKNLFDCSSKFHHKMSKDKTQILPEIKASKEDAYLMYVTSAGIVNLLARKIRRHKNIL